MRWPLPPAHSKLDGTLRKVGVEFELQGPAVDELATIVGSTPGGTIQRVSDAEYLVATPTHGEYRVETTLSS